MEIVIEDFITFMLLISASIVLFKINETVGVLFVAVLIVTGFQKEQPEPTGTRARQSLHNWLVQSSTPTIFTYCGETTNEKGYTDCIFITPKNDMVKVECYSRFHYIFYKTHACIPSPNKQLTESLDKLAR